MSNETYFLITYDLCKPGQDYVGLWEKLENLNAKRLLESVWIIKQQIKDLTCSTLNTSLKKYIDQNDKLLIVEFVNIWGSGFATSDTPMDLTIHILETNLTLLSNQIQKKT